MKILLLGKTGMVGKAIFSVFAEHHVMITPSRSACDVTHKEHLQEAIRSHNPEIIINATGYAKVDQAEREPEAAYRLNVEAVQNIIDAIGKKNIPLVHFSTDYVFDGEKNAGYSEDESEMLPLSVYGATKAEAEKRIIAQLRRFYLIRTAWLYGPFGTNFVDRVLEAGSLPKVPVVNDQIGNPTYTLDLAQAVFRLLEGNPYGIYHLVNEGSVSWYDFARAIFEKLGVPREIVPITSSELNRPARRPASSILRNTRLPPLRPWQKALEAYLSNKTLILS